MTDTSCTLLGIPQESIGLTEIGDISIDVSGIKEAKRLNLVLHTYYNTLSSCRYTNTYPLWVYPENNDTQTLRKNIIVTDRLTDEIGRKLQQGARVLIMPDSTQFRHQTVGALFQTDYWNYRMFRTICEKNKKPVSPGTLGLLMSPQHPIFNSFPTEEHTNWQWFPMIKASRPFILDNTPADYRPVVQVIDNVERNHKLGLIFEFTVGKGRLLVCMSDLLSVQQYPEARQLYASILRYMQSDKFNPSARISFNSLNRLFTEEIEEGHIGELRNISFE